MGETGHGHGHGHGHDAAGLALASGECFWGVGVGATGVACGELCFNTSMTGYQEIVSDLSYAGQVIVFTFPHIGNVGTNDDDMESSSPAARGVVLASGVSAPSSYRSRLGFSEWLRRCGVVGICGVDTRALTLRLREGGAVNAALCHVEGDVEVDMDALLSRARALPSLEGVELARSVTCRRPHGWSRRLWNGVGGEGGKLRIVAVDYGAKRNTLRHLAERGGEVKVMPACASGRDILARRPDGVFLSNGPGDPAATAAYASAAIRDVLAAGVPLFGICLGHQLLALALGGSTAKMHFGHHGANHPVRRLSSGRVEITSQNHGFLVAEDSLPSALRVTHRSLFDATIEGLELCEGAAFSVQYHPEASPGPHDSAYLFDRFMAMAGSYRRRNSASLPSSGFTPEGGKPQKSNKHQDKNNRQQRTPRQT